ncbi:MAG: hypothetical protein LBJ01_00345 [Tannerella sp.]|jgi:hypothetical protein|nr:hypothetical protein [Tannerella sp.]
MNSYKAYLLKSIIACSALLLPAGAVYGQSIVAEPRAEVKRHAGEPYQARIDFISESPDLVFEENTGADVQAPRKQGNREYVYTCICNVKEDNRFGFNIMLKGSEAACFWKVLVEEGQWIETDVKVEASSVILHVQPGEGGYFPQENTALVRIVSTHGELNIEASTGEKAELKLDETTNTYHYNVYFDLSQPESRQIERALLISVAGQNDPPHVHPLGLLASKQALEIAVIVINNCYANQLQHARQCYVNGDFADAFRVYQNLLETDLCSDDKPEDLSAMKEEMEKTGLFLARMDSANLCWTKLESFHEQNRLDSCLYYLNLGTKVTARIAEHQPLNAFCKEMNRKYKDMRKKMGRIVSGTVYLDAGSDKPAGNTLITVSRHEKKMKKVGGIFVPVPGREIEDAYRKTYSSNADGSFTVPVREEAQSSKTMYVIHFIAGSGRDVATAEYVPEDRASIPDLHITLVPAKK